MKDIVNKRLDESLSTAAFRRYITGTVDVAIDVTKIRISPNTGAIRSKAQDTAST